MFLVIQVKVLVSLMKIGDLTSLSLSRCFITLILYKAQLAQYMKGKERQLWKLQTLQIKTKDRQDRTDFTKRGKDVLAKELISPQQLPIMDLITVIRNNKLTQTEAEQIRLKVQ